LLDKGVVGHDTLPPSPNHGFTVPLPDVGRTSPASADDQRFVSVDASYDMWEDKSLAGAVSEKEHDAKDAGGLPRNIVHKATKLAGLRAIRSTVESTTAKGTVVDVRVGAERSGIVYTISLHTSQQYLSVDDAQFKRILSGFRLLKLPLGECSNG
jgi:hypothetical protein